jgi:hypothetical protein
MGSSDASPASPPLRAVYVDALNFARLLFFCDEGSGSSGGGSDDGAGAEDAAVVGSPAALRAAGARVAAFAAAARRSGLRAVAFVDLACVSEEARAKRRARRERGVREAARGVPHAAPQLLCEMLDATGVEVRLSREADCDDTLAAHAAADGVDVLSRDRDFSRYFLRRAGEGAAARAGGSDDEPARLRVFAGVDERALARGSLVLTCRAAPPAASSSFPSAPSPRLLPSPPPRFWTARDAPLLMRLLRLTRAFDAGAPSPLTRALGNAHAATRQLRRALYSVVFAGDGPGVRVRESWPEWDAAAGAVAWREEEVLVGEGGAGSDEAAAAAAADALRLLLGPPDAAFAACFPREARALCGDDAALGAGDGAAAAAAAAANTPPARVSAAKWRAHAHACRAVVLELCAAATGSSLLGMLARDARL